VEPHDPSDRGRLIWKIGDLILEHAEELAQLESLDNGKPFRSLDEIAAEANNTGYGLGAGIWTKDISKALAAIRGASGSRYSRPRESLIVISEAPRPPTI
jgi:acyl-CoA reductase-like NAD-dependent aldehyde dehydrogenase